MKTTFFKTLFLSASILATTASFSTLADDVIRIEVGEKRGGSSRQELERRVWQLERAVYQLQDRIFDLETKKPERSEKVESWICTVSAMGGTYTGTGSSKAEAMAKSINNCKKEANDNGFFCKNPKCEK